MIYIFASSLFIAPQQFGSENAKGIGASDIFSLLFSFLFSFEDKLQFLLCQADASLASPHLLLTLFLSPPILYHYRGAYTTPFIVLFVYYSTLLPYFASRRYSVSSAGIASSSSRVIPRRARRSSNVIISMSLPFSISALT